jgi:hypothetical protein
VLGLKIIHNALLHLSKLGEHSYGKAGAWVRVMVTPDGAVDGIITDRYFLIVLKNREKITSHVFTPTLIRITTLTKKHHHNVRDLTGLLNSLTLLNHYKIRINLDD